uniref:Uncharacterized protein n=1 Tax=Arundo donax TaxID=35708 RepID=A0A0A9B2W0_ARUDO
MRMCCAALGFVFIHVWGS